MLITTGYAILLLCSLLGNALLIGVFYRKYDQLRTPVNYFIVNMAASDLLVPLLVIPRRIQEVYIGWGYWLVGGVMGNILCKVVHLADEVSVTVSSQSMVFIAAERFWSIVFPMKSPLISRRTAPRFICFTWIFSLIWFSYYFFTYNLGSRQNHPYCSYELPQLFDKWQDLWRVDRMSLFVAFVVVPFILITVFYTTILVSIHQKRKSPLHLASKAKRVRAQENRRVTLMLVAVVVLFFTSWTPYLLHVFIQYYSSGQLIWSCSSRRQFYLASRFVSYIYTAINPLIYYTFSTNYRKGFQEMVCCPWSCLRGCSKSSHRGEEGEHFACQVIAEQCSNNILQIETGL